MGRLPLLHTTVVLLLHPDHMKLVEQRLYAARTCASSLLQCPAIVSLQELHAASCKVNMSGRDSRQGQQPL
jgi:hypothetical protein